MITEDVRPAARPRAKEPNVEYITNVRADSHAPAGGGEPVSGYEITCDLSQTWYVDSTNPSFSLLRSPPQGVTIEIDSRYLPDTQNDQGQLTAATLPEVMVKDERSLGYFVFVRVTTAGESYYLPPIGFDLEPKEGPVRNAYCNMTFADTDYAAFVHFSVPPGAPEKRGPARPA